MDVFNLSVAPIPQLRIAFIGVGVRGIEAVKRYLQLEVQIVAIAEVGAEAMQKVKALTGYSPVEMLRKARLARARQLLQTTDKNVSEVAYAVGFSTPSYFSKCYKEEFGESPKK